MPMSGDIEIYSWGTHRDEPETDLRAVVEFGKRFKATVGFLPDAAFDDRARAGTLTIARSEGRVIGYILYSHRRSVLKLTHVCVDPELRRSGLALSMLNHVIVSHANATGIIADCRRDYGPDRFWSGMGFSSRGERPGRGRDGHPLARWWRPLGGPDLFDYLVSSTTLPLVVLDANVVIDLCCSPTIPRPQRESSKALEADWLSALVEYAVSPEVDNELHRTADDAERVSQQNASQRFHRLKTTRPNDELLEQELLVQIGKRELARDNSLADDIKHLADAIRSGAAYFVTNDGNLLNRTAGWSASTYGIDVLRPHELAVRIFEADREDSSFDAGVFEHIDLHWTDGASTQELELKETFMNFPDRERASVFRSTLRAVVAQRDTHTLRVLRDSNEVPLALVSAVAGNDLTVPLLRVARHPLSSSIALQLTRELRRNAIDEGVTTVYVTDPAPGENVKRALIEDGFSQVEGGYEARSYVEHLDRFIAPSADLAEAIGDISNLVASAIPVVVEQLERRFWPLRIWDEATPCYIIPIRPYAGMDLFDYPFNLFPQKRVLGLSRNHVYYRSGHSDPFGPAPARILWYMSKDRSHGVHEYFAYSRMTNSEVLQANAAHERYSQLGAYNRAAVKAIADKRGRVNVVHLEDTELLHRPLPLNEFRSIAARHGVLGEMQGPRRIPAMLFREIMLMNHLPYGA
jgi:predicted nucleic acid-binding protein/predicted GNAT family acetyltransferase